MDVLGSQQLTLASTKPTGEYQEELSADSYMNGLEAQQQTELCFLQNFLGATLRAL